jgi:hypothetical protein
MNAIVLPLELEHDPLEVDLRPCELCGLTIDRHEMIDDGDGPLFYCPDLSPDEMTLPELERRAELRRQEEIAAIIADMEAADDLIPIRPVNEPSPYRTPQSTVDAFWFVIGLADPERFKAWLADRPKDAPFLLKLLETK